MSDSSTSKCNIGFSTGALEKGDYWKAVHWLGEEHIHCAELSALRFPELGPLVRDLDRLPVGRFEYVSFHAPSFFPEHQENEVIRLLQPVLDRGWNIIVHPDVIYHSTKWRLFGRQLLIENMDCRKPLARTSEELSDLFDELPEARLCLDVAHARQLDTTLNLLQHIIDDHVHRIAEIHISELDSSCRHHPMSNNAVSDYRYIAKWINKDVPIIIESTLEGRPESLRMEEYRLAFDAMCRSPLVSVEGD